MQVQDNVATDLERLEQVSLSIHQDLGEQRKSADSQAIEFIDFFQFWTAIPPLMNAVRRYRFAIARDWAYRGLVDDYEANRLGDDVHIERLPRFFTSRDLVPEWEAVLACLDYASAVFFVASETGDLFDFVPTLAPFLAGLAQRALSAAGSIGSDLLAETALDAVTGILNWSDQRDAGLAVELAAALDRYESDDANPDRHRQRAAVVLCGSAARHTDISSRERARHCLARYGESLDTQERLGLMANALVGEPNDILANLPALLEAIEAYLAERQTSSSPIDQLYVQTRMFKTYIGGVFVTLAHSGHVNAALQLLGRWHGIDGVRDDVVLILSADISGTLWIHGDLIQQGSSEPTTLGAFLATANRALGLAITYTDAGEAGMPQAPDRPGIPNRSAGPEYQAACNRHFRPDALAELAAEGASGGLVMVPGLPVSSPALALPSGRAWPLATSLRAPLPDRVVRQVAVWATAVAGVDEEVAALGGFFGDAAIAVEIIQGDLSLERFAALYGRDDLDVLWLTCHGEQAIYAPEETHIKLSDDNWLTVEQMLDLPAPGGSQRRLLVLNACDSASSATFGGLTTFGPGAILAGPTQGVLGHMWPIEVISGAGFGAVLGASLARGYAFLESYGHATTALRGGPDGLLAALEEETVVGDLRDRLEARSNAVDHEPGILDWGSPVFFE